MSRRVYGAHADDDVKYKAVTYRPPGIDPSLYYSVDVSIGTANQFLDVLMQVPEAPWFFFNLGLSRYGWAN